MFAIRILMWYFADDTALYTVIVQITGFVNVICYFRGMILLTHILKIEKIHRGIELLDSISYEFYLIHALFISGATSMYGVLNNKMVEIFAFLAVTVVLSYFVKNISNLIMAKRKT